MYMRPRSHRPGQHLATLFGVAIFFEIFQKNYKFCLHNYKRYVIVYTSEKREGKTMSYGFKTYSRKQAGVIYSAMKRGDIEVSSNVISTMYDMVGMVDICNTNQLSFVENFAAGIKNAIDAIFENNFDSATKTLAALA